jgi:hypothetical protein
VAGAPLHSSQRHLSPSVVLPYILSTLVSRDCGHRVHRCYLTLLLLLYGVGLYRPTDSRAFQTARWNIHQSDAYISQLIDSRADVGHSTPLVSGTQPVTVGELPLPASHIGNYCCCFPVNTLWLTLYYFVILLQVLSRCLFHTQL